MAIATAFVSVNMNEMPVWETDTIPIAEPDQIRVTGLTGEVEDFHGTGFTYDGFGSVTGGTVTGIDFALDTVAQWSVTGLTHDAVEVQAYWDVDDDLGLQSFLFSGNDRLNSSPGNDTLNGYGGNDTYAGVQAGDVVSEAPNEGTDTITTSASMTLPDNVENLVYTGTADRNGTGNQGHNEITGNSGVNVLKGSGGNDTLHGGGGNDTLIGDTVAAAGGDLTPTAAGYLTAGNSLIDTLGGVRGFGEGVLERNDDYPSVDLDVTEIFGASGLNFFGTSYPTFWLNTNGNITFTDSMSQFTPDVIGGGLGIPVIAPLWTDVDTRDPLGLLGLFDPDSLTPTPGGNSTGSNLLYYDSDTTNRVFTATWDDVGYYSQHTEHLSSFQLQLIDRGAGSFDIVFRYEAINWTTGEASDGTADGLGGTVARAGYSVGTGTDYFELAQSGNESQILALDATAGNTGITGVYVFNVRAGEVSSSGNDLLDGGAGADAMRGGAGNDTYIVAQAGDAVFETAGAGSDLVKSSISYLLPTQVEKLTLTGTGAINGTGNTVANTLTGNSGVNTLKGMAGNDILSGAGGGDKLFGGAGNDKLTGGNGADKFVFDSALSGTKDTILDFSRAQGDKIWLDNDVFTALGSLATTTPLTSGAFVAGAAAGDGGDRIIYNSATGALFYDSDGTGGAVQVQFGTVGANTHPALAAADFQIIN